MTEITTPTSHSSYYILNREYFSECFDESATIETGFNAYRKAVILFVIAVGLFFTDINAYASWFILALAVLEVFSIRYRRSWWIARQMISRASGSKVNIHLDEQGVRTDSIHHQQSIAWDEVSELKETDKGFVITHHKGRNYFSKSGLEEAALAFLKVKAKTVNNH